MAGLSRSICRLCLWNVVLDLWWIVSKYEDTRHSLVNIKINISVWLIWSQFWSRLQFKWLDTLQHSSPCTTSPFLVLVLLLQNTNMKSYIVSHMQSLKCCSSDRKVQKIGTYWLWHGDAAVLRIRVLFSLSAQSWCLYVYSALVCGVFWQVIRFHSWWMIPTVLLHGEMDSACCSVDSKHLSPSMHPELSFVISTSGSQVDLSVFDFLYLCLTVCSILLFL